jgi:hypothetical protein
MVCGELISTKRDPRLFDMKEKINKFVDELRDVIIHNVKLLLLVQTHRTFCARPVLFRRRDAIALS